ncbi:oligosaccharide flippase family protein [bacterium]|nr:oligosaccharide flippase family protein [bacterium]
MSQLSLSERAGIISLGRFSENLVNIAVAVLLSRLLIQQDYGTYRQAILVIHTLISILMLGLPMSMYYFIPRMKREEQKGFVIQTFLLLSGIGLVFTLLVFNFAPLIATKFNNPDLTPYLKMFSFYGWLTLPVLYVESLLIAIDRIKKAFIASLFMNLGRFAAILVAVLWNRDLATIFTAYIVFAGVNLLVLTYFSASEFKTSAIKFNPRLLLAQINYALPLGLSDAIGVLAREIDKIFISLFFVASQYAVYANGAINIPFIRTIPGAVGAVLMPRFVTLFKEKNNRELLQVWHESIRLVALIFLPLMFYSIIFARDIMVLLFSQNYSGSALPFMIYNLGIAGMVTIWANMLAAMGHTRDILKISIFAVLLNILLNYILIHTIGFLGPAVATIIQKYAIIFIYLVIIRKKLGVTTKDVFPWKNYVNTFLVAGVCALPLLTLNSIPMPEILRLAAGGLAYLVIFVIIARNLGILKDADLTMLKKWLSNIRLP